MSEEDKDAAVGKLVREYSETKTELTLLTRRAEETGEFLAALGSALKNRHNLYIGQHPDATGGLADLGKLPAPAQLVELANKIDKLKAQKNNLRISLREVGYDPKE